MTPAAARANPTRYIAFLRGMNVGGHRITMPALRAHFAAIALDDVATFIASGNVIFTAPGRTEPAALERRIEMHLRDALGYAVATFLRTPAELAAIVQYAPFAAREMSTPGYTVHVGFLRSAPDATVIEDITRRATAMDAFAVHGRELYWLCRGKTTDSLVKWPAIERATRLEVTMRNMSTVRRLAETYLPLA